MIRAFKAFLKSKNSEFYHSLWNNKLALKRLSPFISKRYYHLENEEFYDIQKFQTVQITPNLVIIGAQKSGTTSLHNYLDKHANIFMSKPIKEPGYFCDFEFISHYFKNLPNGPVFKSRADMLKNYMLQGYTGQRYFGESSTYYSDGFQDQKYKVVSKMYNSNPDTKLIYILRNPLARIVSSYLHNQRKGYTDLPINEFLQKEKSVLEISLYGKQLSTYLKHFPKEQIYITFFEKLIKQPNIVLNEIADFLSIEKFAENESFAKFNVSTNKKQFKKEDLIISKENYKTLMEQITPDVLLLESQSGLKTDFWDFAEEKWCTN